MKTIKQAKIINENWKYKIEFAKDSFWPYEFVFSRTDCYYNDKIGDRWSVLFPYKNKEFNNTEIFLETDDIVVCTWDRTNLSWEEKTFIDIINLKTEKKQRLYVEEVNLIFNGENEIVINANFGWVWKTVKLDNYTMEIKEEKEEKLLSFFKAIYNENENKWYRIRLVKEWFEQEMLENIIITPLEANRKDFFTNIMYTRLYPNSDYDFNDVDFINNQKYLINQKIRKKVLYYDNKPFLYAILFIILTILPLIYLNVDLYYNFSNYDDNVLEGIYSLYFRVLFFWTYFISELIRYFKDLKNAIVFKKSLNKKFSLSDYKIVRNNSKISSKKQKIMIK